VILGKPDLQEAGERFRAAADLWHQMALTALPDSSPLLKEARQLLLRRRALFVAGGEGVTAERAAIRERLEAIRAAVAVEFPLSEAEVSVLLGDLSEQVSAISQIEREAVGANKRRSITARRPSASPEIWHQAVRHLLGVFGVSR